MLIRLQMLLAMSNRCICVDSGMNKYDAAPKMADVMSLQQKEIYNTVSSSSTLGLKTAAGSSQAWNDALQNKLGSVMWSSDSILRLTSAYSSNVEPPKVRDPGQEPGGVTATSCVNISRH